MVAKSKPSERNVKPLNGPNHRDMLRYTWQESAICRTGTYRIIGVISSESLPASELLAGDVLRPNNGQQHMLVLHGTLIAEDSAADRKDLMSYQRGLMILWMLAMAACVGCTSLTMGSDYDVYECQLGVKSTVGEPLLRGRLGTGEGLASSREF
jgi:hypothetical protein